MEATFTLVLSPPCLIVHMIHAPPSCRCEEELLDAALLAGSTALVALLVDGNLHIANVGDCRAVVCDEAQVKSLKCQTPRKQSSSCPYADALYVY